MPLTNKEALHTLIDLMPECAWEEANRLLLGCLDAVEKGIDPYSLLEAPEAPPPPAEIAAMEEA